MKRSLLFLVVAVLTACTCLPQIPTQYVYVGNDCEASLPDYRNQVTVSDNCAVNSFTQTPLPGFVLNVAIPNVTVVLEAIDNDGNISTAAFDVELLDTISPTITPHETLMGQNLENFGKIHRVYHESVITLYDSLRLKYPDEDQDTSYRHDNFVTISNPDARYIVSTFSNPNWKMFATDSAYLVDTCGFNINLLRLQFSQN